MSIRYAGVDGCNGGWFWIGFGDDGDWASGVEDQLEKLVGRLPELEVMLVDIPIGLRSVGSSERKCDKKARGMLGQPRASSVFPAPCRSAVYESDPGKAFEINAALTGRQLSRQTTALIPKIREVDELLRGSDRARSVVREMHPEVCFWALNGAAPVEAPKKNSEGRRRRLEILVEVDARSPLVVADTLLTSPLTTVSRDDVLDALVGAVTACHPDDLETIPADVPTDSSGLRMEMVYWRR